MPKKLHVYEERCPKNHPCPAVRVCPTKALTQKDNHSAPDASCQGLFNQLQEKVTFCGLPPGADA